MQLVDKAKRTNCNHKTRVLPKSPIYCPPKRARNWAGGADTNKTPQRFEPPQRRFGLGAKPHHPSRSEREPSFEPRP